MTSIVRRLILAIILAVCGILAAFSIVARGASPGIADLPALGYTLAMQFNAQTQCGNYVVVSGNGVDREVLIGDLPPRCSSADQEAQRIAVLLSEFPPPGVAPVTVTLPAVTVTETTAGETVTEPAVTLPAVTLPTVTVQHTDVQTVTETVVQTVTGETVTVQAVVPDAPWMVALGYRSAALNVVYGLV